MWTMSPPWEELLPSRVRRVNDRVVWDVRQIATDPGMISFFASSPDPESYPVEDFRLVLRQIMREEGLDTLQYAPPAGHGPRKTHIAEKLRNANIPAQEENLLILSGSIQGLDLVAELLLDPGDTVLVEEPTFYGALEIFDKYEATYVTLPMDGDGLRVDLLSEILNRQPAKPLFLMPNCHNPVGVDLSVARRHQLIAISQEYGLPLVTSDPYGDLRYQGRNLLSWLHWVEKRTPSCSAAIPRAWRLGYESGGCSVQPKSSRSGGWENSPRIALPIIWGNGRFSRWKGAGWSSDITRP